MIVYNTWYPVLLITLEVYHFTEIAVPMSQFYLALILHIHDLNISKPQLLNFHNHPLLDHKLVLRFSHLKQIHPHLLYSIPTKTSLQTQHQLRLQSYLLLCLETLIIEDLTLTSQHLGHPLLSNPPFGLFNINVSAFHKQSSPQISSIHNVTVLHGCNGTHVQISIPLHPCDTKKLTFLVLSLKA